MSSFLAWPQVIMMSSVALACEDPVEADSEWNKKLTYFDYGFTCVFGVEVLLKVLVLRDSLCRTSLIS